jgi:glycosyltransferase involved in cell wall biosynthesis
MYTNRPSGVGVYTEALLKQLCVKLESAEIGFDIYAYSKDGIDQEVEDISLGTFLDGFCRPFLSLHRVLWNIFFLPFIAKSYSLIYSFSSHGSPFVKNQVITIHDLICLRFPLQHPFQYIYFKFILPSIINSSKKIVVISEFTKAEVLKFYNVAEEKIIVIHNGADHYDTNIANLPAQEEMLFQLTRGRQYFITVGASYKHKNIERLIEAIAQAKVDAFFIIVGAKGRHYSILSKKLKQSKLQDVIFLDYVSRDFLKYLYSRAICNIYVSLYEGFGFTPMEAASFSTLSIVSNTTSLPEIYQNSVVYSDPYNVTDIADKIKSVAKGHIDTDFIKKSFPALLGKFTWRVCANNIHNVISSCLK